MKIDLKNKKALKDFLFQTGRLLERKVYSVIFENKPKISFLPALKAYQNTDKGFGHGLEPDLLTPSSTGVGAETALCLLDMVDLPINNLVQEIAGWVYQHINDIGILPYPPEDLMDYPHQPWWENADNERILAVSGFLSKFHVVNPEGEQKIARHIQKKELPQKIEIYDYPLFVYALYHQDYKEREKILNHFIPLLPGLMINKKEHHPLFSRYWYHAIPLLPKKLVDEAAENVINDIKEDGGIVNPYPQLPWWRPIFTLDAFLLLRKYHYC